MDSGLAKTGIVARVYAIYTQFASTLVKTPLHAFGEEGVSLASATDSCEILGPFNYRDELGLLVIYSQPPVAA
ncbi:hypothetical protein [Ferrimicrobium acidiphilum]|uniref:hypothetical protein n=1 Tax=Ferrimicrobium acidiphilum TaxID=121039 RepID=UPI0023F3040A|nr:hypothetical protein [Ferrimicrobium acidiphilum]